MSCLAVIPARGGSVGLPWKNLRKFLGMPLVRRAVLAAQEVPEIDDFVVSTNRERIAAAADTFHIVKRPEDLSTGYVGDVRVLTHALLRYEEVRGVQFDEIVMLQPTSPLRLAADVSRAIQWRREGNFDAVWTVSPTDVKYHPHKQLLFDDGLRFLHPEGATVIARQHLKPTYTRNGVAYVMTRQCLLEQKTTLGANSSAIILDTPQMSIDTEEDLLMAEYLARQRGEQDYQQEGEGERAAYELDDDQRPNATAYA